MLGPPAFTSGGGARLAGLANARAREAELEQERDAALARVEAERAAGVAAREAAAALQAERARSPEKLRFATAQSQIRSFQMAREQISKAIDTEERIKP